MKLFMFLLLLPILANASITAPKDDTYSYCDPIEDLVDYAICLQEEEKFINNAMMAKFIRDTGVGLALQAAVERFIRDYGEMNREANRRFEQLYNREKRRREEEERRRSREGADGRGRGGAWRGHLDNRTLPGVARGGMGA